jgi:hypothetical protein
MQGPQMTRPLLVTHQLPGQRLRQRLFTNLTDFVRAWSSRFVVKCETGHLIDTHVLRWQAS